MDKNYRNIEILNYVDKLAENILIKNNSRELFFPLLVETLGLKTGAEIGVDKGDFSALILENTSIEKMYCIDPWIDDFGSNCRPGYFDKSGNVRMKQAYDKLKPYVDNGRAELVRATGLEASKILPSGLDFIYIDGDHSLEGVFYDVYEWTPKVKIGGIISGHDYKEARLSNSGIKDYWGKQLDYAVKYVVDYYGQRYGYKICKTGERIPSWWFVKV